ncbi:MAG: DegT/DnrJ/EryC1/StrS family aminotransferase, partial [Pseudomonadota bacterium]
FVRGEHGGGREGAQPVFVDVDPQTGGIKTPFNMAALSQRTKAVVVFHPYGRAISVQPLLHPLAARGIRVIEDASMARLAVYPDREEEVYDTAGTLGDFGLVTLGSEDRVALLCTQRADYQRAKRMLQTPFAELFPAEPLSEDLVPHHQKDIDKWQGQAEEQQCWASLIQEQLQGVGDLVVWPKADEKNHTASMLLLRTGLRVPLLRFLHQHHVFTLKPVSPLCVEHPMFIAEGFQAQDFPNALTLSQQGLLWAFNETEWADSQRTDVICRTIRDFFARSGWPKADA